MFFLKSHLRHQVYSTSTEALIVDEVEGLDTNLSAHPDVLWYPTISSWNSVSTEWSFTHFNMQLYGGAPSTWPKLFFTTAAAFGGIPAMRFESASTGTTSFGQGMGGVNIAAMWKYFDDNIRQEQTLTGTSLWSTTHNNLYLRYSFLMEDDCWIHHNELGMKMPGLGTRGYNNNIGLSDSHLWMHHSWPGELYDGSGNSIGTVGRNPPYTTNDTICITTYFAGTDLDQGETFSKNWLPLSNGNPVVSGQSNGFHIIQPNTWYTVEQFWKVNSATSSGAGIEDGEVRIWFDDTLVWSQTEQRSRVQYNTSGYDPVGNIDHLYLIIYHGGQDHVPTSNIHYQITGICLANRRIGKTKAG